MKENKFSYKVSVFGLGKLGTPFVLAAASRNLFVKGFDIAESSRRALNTGKFHIVEPQIEMLWKRNKKRIQVTGNPQKALLDSDITFVIVPTPSLTSGAFSNKYIIKALREIAKGIKIKNTFHVISIVSTVIPASSEKVCIPLLEKYSRKKRGIHFGFCYNPAFIALGSVVKNLLEPDFVLIGESDKKSGDILETFYKRFCINNPPINRVSLVNAEIAKLSLNTFITAKISYANMIAGLCEAIPGADANEVLKTIGQDKRVGPLYLRAGVCYGGPCFPRDNKALISVGKRFGVSLPIAQATDTVNNRHSKNIFNRLKKLITKKDKITILGLSYKPDTNVVDKSQSITLIDLLISEGYKVTVYDPVSMENAKRIYGSKINYSQNLENSLKSSAIIVIVTNWTEFQKINNKHLQLMKKNPVIFDCWGLLSKKNFPSVRYVRVGKSYE